MKTLLLFNVASFVIGLGYLIASGGDGFAVCILLIFVLPALIVVDLVWLIVLAVLARISMG